MNTSYPHAVSSIPAVAEGLQIDIQQSETYGPDMCVNFMGYGPLLIK